MIRGALMSAVALAVCAAVLPHVPLHPDTVPSPAAVSSSPASDTLQVTAAHEAGHVAVLREFGIPVLRVEVAADGSGETAYPDGQDPYDYAVIDAAGQESAAAWLVTHRGYTLDQALAETESAARSDLADLRVDAAHAGVSETQARQRAQVIVHNHRAEIDRIAQQIIENGGSLSGRDLERKDG